MRALLFIIPVIVVIPMMIYIIQFIYEKISSGKNSFGQMSLQRRQSAIAKEAKKHKVADIDETLVEILVLRRTAHLHRNTAFKNILLTTVDNILVVLEMLDYTNSTVPSTYAVKYKHKLKKLNSLIGEDHYLAIERNPERWSKPKDRLREIEEAAIVFKEETIADIKAVNEAKNTEYNVALASLNGAAAAEEARKELLGENENDVKIAERLAADRKNIEAHRSMPSSSTASDRSKTINRRTENTGHTYRKTEKDREKAKKDREKAINEYVSYKDGAYSYSKKTYYSKNYRTFDVCNECGGIDLDANHHHTPGHGTYCSCVSCEKKKYGDISSRYSKKENRYPLSDAEFKRQINDKLRYKDWDLDNAEEMFDDFYWDDEDEPPYRGRYDRI